MSPFTATTKTPTTDEANNNVKLGDNCSDDTAVTMEDLAVATKHAPSATVFVFGKKMVAAMVLAIVVAVTFGAVALGQQVMIRRDVAAARQGFETAMMSLEKNDGVNEGGEAAAAVVESTSVGNNPGDDEKVDTGSSHRNMLLRPSQRVTQSSSGCPRVSAVGSGTSGSAAGRACGSALSAKGCRSWCRVGVASFVYNSRTGRYTGRCTCS